MTDRDELPEVSNSRWAPPGRPNQILWVPGVGVPHSLVNQDFDGNIRSRVRHVPIPSPPRAPPPAKYHMPLRPATYANIATAPAPTSRVDFPAMPPPAARGPPARNPEHQHQHQPAQPRVASYAHPPSSVTSSRARAPGLAGMTYTEARDREMRAARAQAEHDREMREQRVEAPEWEGQREMRRRLGRQGVVEGRVVQPVPHVHVQPQHGDQKKTRNMMDKDGWTKVGRNN
ncbi:hypothetical protein EDC01DRAFT_636431 [Geopyxis carbonaria]|nr:hypothetical protein EDC01DRAFT_636431 [Geopyxis carbonaria]